MRLENWLYILGAGLLVTIVFMVRYNGIDAGLYQVRDDGVITMSAGRHIVDFGFVGISPSGPIVEASSSPLQMIVYATVYALSEAAYTTFAKYQTIFTTFLLGASLGLIFLESRTAGLCTILLVSLGLSAVYPFFLWHGSGMENAITHALLVLSIAGLLHMIRTEKIAYVWAIPLVLTCFSSRSDYCHSYPIVTQLSSNSLLCLFCLPSPKVTSVPYTHFPIVNPEIDWFFSLTLDDNDIIASPLKLSTPKFANL